MHMQSDDSLSELRKLLVNEISSHNPSFPGRTCETIADRLLKNAQEALHKYPIPAPCHIPDDVDDNTRILLERANFESTGVHRLAIEGCLQWPGVSDDTCKAIVDALYARSV
jgi:hypothetical protein